MHLYYLCHHYRVGNKKRLVKVWNAMSQGDQQWDQENLQLHARKRGFQWILDALARRRGVNATEVEAINQALAQPETPVEGAVPAIPQGIKDYVEAQMRELNATHRNQSEAVGSLKDQLSSQSKAANVRGAYI